MGCNCGKSKKVFSKLLQDAKNRSLKYTGTTTTVRPLTRAERIEARRKRIEARNKRIAMRNKRMEIINQRSLKKKI